jgi:hypothetical protein
MIMGLERLDRITAVMQEQAGPLQPVEFPPPRHPGPSSQLTATAIREDPAERPRRDGAASLSGSMASASSSQSIAEAANGQARMGSPDKTRDANGGSRERLASSAAGGPSYDSAGRDRVSAGVAAAAAMRNMRDGQSLSGRSATVDSAKGRPAQLDGQVGALSHVPFPACYVFRSAKGSEHNCWQAGAYLPKLAVICFE